jgi:hypothetical protein
MSVILVERPWLRVVSAFVAALDRLFVDWSALDRVPGERL